MISLNEKYWIFQKVANMKINSMYSYNKGHFSLYKYNESYYHITFNSCSRTGLEVSLKYGRV
jgi:hypothetical protein